MADPLVVYIRQTLPADLSLLLVETLDQLEQGRFFELFSLPAVKSLLGHDAGKSKPEGSHPTSWNESINEAIPFALQNSVPPSNAEYLRHLFLVVATASLHAFLQANVTGPPLPFASGDVLLSKAFSPNSGHHDAVRSKLRGSLSVDGEAAYKLTPNVELLCLSRTILQHPEIKSIKASAWARLRTDFVHQRILSEVSPSLQKSLYDGLDVVDGLLQVHGDKSDFNDLIPAYLLEKASIHTHHGQDSRAREVLDDAAKRRNFTFALTGLLGKRTKYQERDTSQLVVLARSNDVTQRSKPEKAGLKPQALDLNDDTLLENIVFTKTTTSSPGILDSSNLPPTLASLDPSNQPILDPIDSIILLSLATSITNTRPEDGLTREETLPYAQRVLAGGSSNWQIYTQALLIRSRIEGHRSRTTERGLLQLQALVDQVISETTEAHPVGTTNGSSAEMTPAITINDKPTIDSASTFLPRASATESAPVSDRLLYIHALASPTRWELEAELAARWVGLGGLRTALEIYERLEMWAEAALCWAATDREDKAKKIVRGLLFTPSNGSAIEGVAGDYSTEAGAMDDGPPRDPAPADAPRLYCILGDIDSNVNMYEKAWEVSGGRYARAQRSVGRHWFSRSTKDGDVVECLRKAAAAYSKSLKINQLHGPSWFALGCALLELQEFDKAAEAFARVVQLDETDAESWSNLATSLLKKGSTGSILDDTSTTSVVLDDEESGEQSTAPDPQQNIRAALRALRRAASLKHDSARIWDNLITVALSLSPPSFSDILSAERRVLALRGPTEGEACVDADVIEVVMRDVIAIDYFITGEDGKRIVNPDVTRGTPRVFVDLLETHITPLITSSPRLWRILSTVALWRSRPGEALDAMEKGWRAAMASAGWEDGDEKKWQVVVDATIELVDGYESLGDRPREIPLDEPVEKAELVAKDWKFKARSAIRGVTGKAKNAWKGNEGYDRLRDRLEDLKS